MEHKTQSQLLQEAYQTINEGGVDSTIEKVLTAMGDKDMMSMGKNLESAFGKKNVSFNFSPVAHYRITNKPNDIIIVNSKYADDAEATKGDYAVGFNGSV